MAKIENKSKDADAEKLKSDNYYLLTETCSHWMFTTINV